MKILLVVMIWLTGVLFGFSLAAWALYEPVYAGPAKYALTQSPGPVPPYVMDGSKKLMRIECISESEKDCPQATAVPEPGTIGLLGIGLIGLAAKLFLERLKILLEPMSAGSEVSTA